MNKTSRELGFEEGYRRSFERGRHEGTWKFVVFMFEAKFGPLSAFVEELLAGLTVQGLQEVAVELLHAESSEDLGLGESAVLVNELPC